MRCGILSDIHGNLEALDAVLDRLSRAHVSCYLCLGDIVGYGADPDACCQRIRALNARCVAGNHDLAALGVFDLSWFNPVARAAAEWTARQLSPENRAFLQSLPEEVADDGFQMVHGSLEAPTSGYVLDTFAARASLDLQVEPVCFIGHTHVPALYARRRGGLMAAALTSPVGVPVPLDPNRQYLVNCGSVGQPRDGNPEAAYGIYDADACTIEWHRVPYDVAAAQQKIRAAGLPHYLADRLARGV